MKPTHIAAQFPALIKPGRLFFALSAAFFIAGLLWVIAGSPVSISIHPFGWNVFFVNYTFIGNGIMPLALALIMYRFFSRKQQAIVIGLACCTTLMLVQLVKNMGSPGPLSWHSEPLQNIIFDGDMLSPTSLLAASSYSAVAFSLATSLAIYTKSSLKQILFFAGAVLLAFSRIYLTQDALPGILMGMLLGTGSTVAAFLFIRNYSGLHFRSKINIKPVARESFEWSAYE
ncbi:MAG: hypothetical protein JWQ27_1112 [Ferruginibacter sp.]|nr:hypothetical protein [Ferruginibacter sp.]